MTPSFTLENEANRANGNTISLGYFLLLKFARINTDTPLSWLRAKRSNLHNFFFRQDMESMLRSSRVLSPQNINRMALVLASGGIFKVIQFIVAAHAIFMISLEGRWSQERQQDKTMNRKLTLQPIAAQMTPHIPSPIWELLENIVSLANSALATGLISGVSRDHFPFFHKYHSSCNKACAQ